MARPAIEKLIHPFQVFAAHKLSGAILLIAAAVVAVVWANSPWAASYVELLALHVVVGVGDFVLEKPLLLWINDGLMGIFFFHVGLEIKRELEAGELSTLRKATLPAAAAVGGMAVPAALYAVLNAGGEGSAGWGIPMATDIAFALGVLALLGHRVPWSLKVFLTALAIVDDIGAVLVIAIFYTEEVSVPSLGIGVGLYVLAIAFNGLRVRSPVAYFVLGTLVWLAFLKSGVHATVAALIMAFTIPTHTRIDGAALVGLLESHIAKLRKIGLPADTTMNTNEQQHLLDEMDVHITEASSPRLRLEHGLVPLVTFLVLPVFALANAGVTLGAGLGEAFAHPITLGIVLGLFVGKQIGVTLFAWLAVKLRIADLPEGVGWRHVYGVGILAGIGFTMSLFIAGLAFPDERLETAKVGILSASLLSGIVGWLVLRAVSSTRTSSRADRSATSSS